jgi:hypothetical protein
MYLRRSKRLSEALNVRYTLEYNNLIKDILRLIQLIIQPEQHTYFMTSDRFIEIRFNHMELCIKKINSKLPFIVYFHKTKSVQVNKFMKFIKAQTINWNKEIQTLSRVNGTDEDDDYYMTRDDDTDEDDSYMIQMMTRIMKNCSKFHKKYEEYRYDYWGYIINKYIGEEHIISIIDEYL